MFAFEEYIKNHKILILNNAEQLDRYENITCDRCYVSWSTWWTKTLFKIYEHLPAGWLDRSRWYGDWKHHVEDYDVIIIINQVRGRDVVEYMRARNPKARIIIYYETTIDPADRKAPQHYQNLGVEFSSFDKKDCDLWNLRYVPYFYSFWNGSMDELRAIQQASSHPETDIFFVGYDKNRLHQLVDLQRELDRLSVTHRMLIVRTPHRVYSPSDSRYLTEHALPYEKIIEHIRDSKCILDYVSEGQVGITLRPMESVFFRKKLITNNPDVVHYDFYCPENVFILGQDDMTTLRQFIDAPYRPLPMNVVQNYTAEAWLDRVLQRR